MTDGGQEGGCTHPAPRLRAAEASGPPCKPALGPNGPQPADPPSLDLVGALQPPQASPPEPCRGLCSLSGENLTSLLMGNQQAHGLQALPGSALAPRSAWHIGWAHCKRVQACTLPQHRHHPGNCKNNTPRSTVPTLRPPSRLRGGDTEEEARGRRVSLHVVGKGSPAGSAPAAKPWAAAGHPPPVVRGDPPPRPGALCLAQPCPSSVQGR